MYHQFTPLSMFLRLLVTIDVCSSIIRAYKILSLCNFTVYTVFGKECILIETF